MDEQFDRAMLPLQPDVKGIGRVDTYSLGPGDTVVITVAEGQTEWQARLLAEQMVRLLADKSLVGVHVLVVTAGQDLTVLSEAAMRRAGWVRAVPEAQPA